MSKLATKEYADTKHKVREAQIQLLYQQTQTGLVGILVVALAACIIFWQVVPQWKITLWAGIVVLVNLIRAYILFAFQKKDPLTSDIDRWATLHVIGVTVSALVWVIPIIFLWPADYLSFQYVWPMIILPLSAAGVATYHTWTPSYLAFLFITVVPISLRFFYEGLELSNIMGLLALFYIAVLLRAGKVMHTASLRATEFGISHEVLSKDLTEVITIKEQLNTNLQQEIAVRIVAEKEKEDLIQELQGALEAIKILKGVIPICMHCKCIRDDKGDWNALEKYISEHSDAEFSHGLCRECAEKYYPDIDVYEDLK